MIKLSEKCHECDETSGTNRSCEHCELVRAVKLLSGIVKEQGDQIRELEKRVTELRRNSWMTEVLR